MDERTVRHVDGVTEAVVGGLIVMAAGSLFLHLAPAAVALGGAALLTDRHQRHAKAHYDTVPLAPAAACA